MKALAELDYSVLQQCMHCGLCLPTCPTYVETKVERNSPRGRIALMRAVADGDLYLSETFAEEMYYCLGCLACVSACPAGVDYAELIETARTEAEGQRVLESLPRDFVRWICLRAIFTRPLLLRFVGRLLWLWQSSGMQSAARKTGLTRLLPARLRELESQTPTIQAAFSHQRILPVETPASPADLRFRVAVLTGCVQDLAYPDVNRATVDVLIENGCEVHTPPVQPCCGSLHAHNGDRMAARALARRQLDLIDPFAFDAIVSNAGGCGLHLRHYGGLLGDDPAYAGRAAEWSRKVRDIHEWLGEIGFRSPAGGPPAGSLTYHESCHLRHGQGISEEPRAVLRSLPGAELSECAECAWCCGSAGIYNITHPATSASLLDRKLGHVIETGARIVATANPGCQLQLENGLRARGRGDIRVAHPVVLLADAYRSEWKGPRVPGKPGAGQ